MLRVKARGQRGLITVLGYAAMIAAGGQGEEVRFATDSPLGGRGFEPSVPPRGIPIDRSRLPFFFASLATVRIPLRCPTRPVGNRLRVCLDGGKAARKGPRIPLPRQRVSLSGPEASCVTNTSTEQGGVEPYKR